ncbi:MAG: hypothetical protein QME57_04735, partial [Patescibacteria group bacterium]|nr:hypothetical protein [Patescibacteria group bacterium]
MKILSTGQIGIGTSTPFALLDIFSDSSSASSLLRIATGTTEALFIDSKGNVGIGTTEPAQKLHVQGNCITGDSLLAIFKQGTTNNKRQTREIQIKDVKPGDYVYSLNQETNQVELHKIKALLDMGVKPVFRLTTESGKSIRTTGNHPYLAIKSEAGNPKPEINSYQSQILNLKQADPYHLTEEYEFGETRVVWSENEITKKSAHLSGFWETTHNAVVLASHPIYNIANQKTLSSFLSSPLYVNNKTKAMDGTELASVGFWVTNQNQHYAPPTASSLYQNNIQKANWIKVIHLSQGDLIAVIENNCQLSTVDCRPYVEWDKIQSIEFVGYEQVYDIVIEGTHNFVANGIVAHNTYISGNVGIGTTEPSAKLTVTATGAAEDGVYISTATTSASYYALDVRSGDTSRLYVRADGNVGIGTTEPLDKLDVNGSIRIRGDLKRDDAVDKDKYLFIPEQTNDNDFKGVAQLRIGPYLTLGNFSLGNTDFIGTNAILDYGSYGDVGSEGNANKFVPQYAPGKGFVVNPTFGGDFHFYGIDWAGSSARKTFPSDFTHIMTLKYDGKVGIGTTAPQSKLHVGGTTSDTFSLGTTSYGGSSGQALTALQSDQATGEPYGGILYFKTLEWGAGTSYLPVTRMTIQSNGNVGIGTTEPSSGLKLDVEGKVGATEYCDENGNNCYDALESITFKVEGEITKFYPVFFNRKNGYGAGIAEFILSRPNVHSDGSWKGSFFGYFRFGLTQWGHTDTFLDFDIRSKRGSYYFVANPRVQCSHGSALVLYLRGDSTYTFKNVRDVSDPVVYINGTSASECGSTVDYPVKTEDEVSIIYGKVNNYPIAYSGDRNFSIMNGNVGIGTTTPDFAKVVVGEGYPQFGVIGETGHKWQFGGGSSAFAIRDVDAGEYRFWIRNDNGNVGIGTTDPGGYKLYVNGTL